MTLPEAVKEFRSRLGYSQQKFATVMNLSIRSVARYEADRAPRQGTLQQFAELAREKGFPDLEQIFTENLIASIRLRAKFAVLAKIRLEGALRMMKQFADLDADAAAVLAPPMQLIQGAINDLAKVNEPEPEDPA